MKKPDFFIVGAPKSGTTALNNYLSQHPDVFMAKKELHRFGSDLKMKIIPSEEEYLQSFQYAGEGKLIGEASVWYLFSKTAAAEIKSFSPAAKIIIMLRNPAEMLPSLHSQNLYNGNEDTKNFKKALDLDVERKIGKSLPESIDFFALPSYFDSALYFEQVKRYLDIFGKANVQIILYDDFIKNTQQIFLDTLKFLNLGSDTKIQFSVINPNKKVKLFGLHKFLKSPPKKIKKIVRIVLPAKKIRHKIMLTLFKLNSAEQKRKDMNEALRKELITFYKDDIQKLGKLINRDLSNWTK
ncbi:MAG: sulfotransferase [Ginsengibacter sp.]